MKKTIFLISSLILLSTLLSCIDYPSRECHLSKLNLKGNVKSIVENDYEALEKFGEITQGNIIGFKDSKIEFNEDGNISTVYQFPLINAMKINNSSLKFLFTEETRKCIYEGNKLKEINNYDMNGDLKGKWKCSYDNKGNLLKEISYNSNGQENGIYEYKYDEKNNLTEVFEIYKGKINYKNSYVYNSKSNIIQYKRSNNNESEIYVIQKYSYDSSDKLISVDNLNRFDGIPEYKTLETYENDEIIKMVDSQNKITFTYSFDNENNWIKKVENINGKPNHIVTRTIEYY